MRTPFMILLMLVFTITSYAQEGFKGEHFIEVTGTAETEIDPNEITVRIRLREFEENKNKTSLEKLDQEFLAALKAAGIDRKRLVLADIGSRLSKLGKKEKDAFRDKTYELVLTSGAELEKFLEKVEPVKVDYIGVTRIHHTDFEKYKLNVKTQAVQAAKSKAEAMLKGIGNEIGKTLMIREWEDGPIYPMPYEANVMLKRNSDEQDAGAPADDPATVFKKIRLTARVTAQFEIK